MNPTVAVLRLPGVNCEAETLAACAAVGLRPTLVQWNDGPEQLRAAAGCVLPGGFSYQDRIRAGAVAAKEPIVAALRTLADSGKPILGICNGAQVLVECGLVPALTPGAVQVALAPNATPGYECRWVHLAAAATTTSPFARALAAQGPLPMPIAHAEGRFTSCEDGLMQALLHSGQLAFRYVDATGEATGDYNPNGSALDTAGMVNPRGNVLALMPHPERATWLRQVPFWLPGPWGEKRRAAQGRLDLLDGPGPGRIIFEALARSAREYSA
jgi:phosphoribosylformylglycinamidine synthase